MDELTIETTTDILAVVIPVFLLGFLLFEILNGKLKGGKKTKEDWRMSGICMLALSLVQRPLLMAFIFLSLGVLFPQDLASLRWIDQQYYSWCWFRCCIEC